MGGEGVDEDEACISVTYMCVFCVYVHSEQKKRKKKNNYQMESIQFIFLFYIIFFLFLSFLYFYTHTHTPIITAYHSGHTFYFLKPQKRKEISLNIYQINELRNKFNKLINLK